MEAWAYGMCGKDIKKEMKKKPTTDDESAASDIFS